MRRLVAVLGVSTLLATALLWACSRSPTAPDGASGNSGPAVPARLEITGPVSTPPGTATQYKAILHLSNNATRDVTTEAQWRSNSVDMGIDRPGLVTGRRNATAMLTAVHTSLTSTREVIFVPDGTFRLQGRVIDPNPPSGPVHDATVEVVTGTGRGQRSGTTEEGHYAIYGVAGTITLRITKRDYTATTEEITIDEHTTRDVGLVAVDTVPDVSGTYTLTISAADTCSGALPADAMVRTYSARVEQVGPALKVAVSGAKFARINGWEANVIRDGRLQQNSVLLSFGTLGCYDYYYGCGPSILEQIGTTRFILPTGTATLPVSPNALHGEINGTIELYEGEAVPRLVRTGQCRSTRHQISFTR